MRKYLVKEDSLKSQKLSSHKPTPLSFDANPELNFIFGRQLINSPQKQTTPAVNKDRVVKIDLTKFLHSNTERTTTTEIPKEDFIEFDMGAEEEESEISEEELEALKKQLNNKAELQRMQLSSKEAELPDKTIDESIPTQKQLEEHITNLDKELKLSNDLIKATQETMKNEVNKVKEENIQQMNKLKLELKEKESLVKRSKDLLFKYNKELAANKSIFKTFTELIKDGLKVNEETSLKDIERLTKYQFIINYGARVISKINLKRIEELTAAYNQLQPKEETHKKYEGQIRKIKDENELLHSQTTELEKVLGSIYQSNVCWGSEDYMNVCRERNQLKEQLIKLQTKYKDEVIKPTNINRLAQILAHIPKRREYEDWDKQKEECVGKVMELERKVNNLLSQLATAINEKGLNEELKKEIIELKATIKLKDDEAIALNNAVQHLNTVLNETKTQLEKITQDSHKKDLAFTQQMAEIKSIFNEMREEKKEKQEEVNKYITYIEELNKKLKDLTDVNNNLKEEKDSLMRETERLKLSSSSNEFKAMISLANIILTRSKSPPLLSQKELDLIKYLFEGNVKELLEEIRVLQQKLKVLTEEVKEVIASKSVLNIISQLMVLIYS